MNILNINGAWDKLGSVVNTYSIIQEGKNAGKISVGNDTWVDKLDFVVIGLELQRALFPPYNPNNSAVLCVSRDATLPSGGASPMPGPCATCKKNQWIKTENGNIPPECHEIYNLLGWDVEKETPFVFPIKRAAIAHLKDLKAKIVFNSLKFSQPGIAANYCMIFALEAQQETYGKKLYYVPFFRLARSFDRAKMLAENAESLVSMLRVENIEKPRPVLLEKNGHGDNRSNEKNGHGDNGSNDNKNLELPNLLSPGWQKERVKFGKAEGLTWQELILNFSVPGYKGNGNNYLRELAQDQNTAIAIVAQSALDLVQENAFGTPPF